VEDFHFKVSLDTYKALQNHIHNGLKISKEDMENMVEKMIDRIVIKKMNDDNFLRTCVDKSVNQSIARLQTNGHWNLEKRIDECIEKAIGEKILQRVRAQMTGIQV